MAFFEPANSKDKGFFENNTASFIPLISIESIILVIYFMESGMEIYHRSFDKVRNFNEHYTKNFKMMIKISTCLIFLADFLLFYSDPVNCTFRFGRLFRPCN